jgi:hypothetical protein
MLEDVIGAGKAAARKLTHARILLKADQSCNGPGWEDKEIGEALEVSVSTVERVRRQFVEEGLESLGAKDSSPPLISFAATESRRCTRGSAHRLGLQQAAPRKGGMVTVLGLPRIGGQVGGAWAYRQRVA